MLPWRAGRPEGREGGEEEAPPPRRRPPKRRRVVGTGAAPGLEISQGKGWSKHREPEGEEAKASSGAVPQPAPMDAMTLAAKGSEEGKCVVRAQGKRSGVKGVSWNLSKNGWQLSWLEGGKGKSKIFPVQRYMKTSGKSYQEADSEALRDAIAFRESLVKDGVVRVASRKSGISLFYWCYGAWQVKFKVGGKTISGGTFRPRDDTPEEAERARLAAVKYRWQLELEHFQIQRKEAAHPSEMLKKRESGVARVSWLHRPLRPAFPPSAPALVPVLAPDARPGRALVDRPRLDPEPGRSHELVEAGAVPGTENFQGECLEPEDEEAKVSLSVVPQPAPMDATMLAATGSERGRCFARVQGKRSGVRGVFWNHSRNGWQLSWRAGGKGKSNTFPDQRFMKTSGKSYQEADADALRDATFQGKGLREHREPEDEEAKASSSAVPQPAPMDATMLAVTGSERGRCVTRVQGKRSGVRGICWDPINNCWKLRWREGGKGTSKTFSVHRYMKTSGKSYQDANAEALRDAIAFRESLVKDGMIRVAGRGVSGSNGTLRLSFKVGGKTIRGGGFRPQDDTSEENERARLAAVERRRQLELEHLKMQRKEAVDPSEMLKKRESGVAGVS